LFRGHFVITHMGARKHGQEGKGLLAPRNVVTYFLVLQMLSKVLVDEVFMHYFDKILSASGPSPPDPNRDSAPGPRWGVASFRPFHYSPLPPSSPLKKILRAPTIHNCLRRTSRIYMHDGNITQSSTDHC